MKTYELRSTCATVKWQGETVALDRYTRVYITVEDRLVDVSIREPEGDFIALAEIELNQDFEEVPLKVTRPVLDFINQHNGELVNGYDLDELVRSTEVGLFGAKLVDNVSI